MRRADCGCLKRTCRACFPYKDEAFRLQANKEGKLAEEVAIARKERQKKAQHLKTIVRDVRTPKLTLANADGQKRLE